MGYLDAHSLNLHTSLIITEEHLDTKLFLFQIGTCTAGKRARDITSLLTHIFPSSYKLNFW